jgi:hypothetical protein
MLALPLGPFDAIGARESLHRLLVAAVGKLGREDAGDDDRILRADQWSVAGRIALRSAVDGAVRIGRPDTRYKQYRHEQSQKSHHEQYVSASRVGYQPLSLSLA